MSRQQLDLILRASQYAIIGTLAIALVVKLAEIFLAGS